MKIFVNVLTCSVLLLGLFGFPNHIQADGISASYISEENLTQQAATLLEQMTTEEKVGQLFLITFQGTDLSESSQVHDLIANRHIGGFVLSESNNNFVGPSNTVESANLLINSLQQMEWDSSVLGHVANENGSTNQYIPLFIGISQEGDSAPYDQIINGVTEMPSLMSIGATWNLDLAEEAGSVLGSELSAIGFNLYLGPSLDVLEVLPTFTGEDLGVRTFGGDPYWVGTMGKAYIKGIHTGSNNRIAVISKHFPGSGGSDREPEKEVATVQKSLEQLKQIELAPFFSVTGNASDSESVTDGLLISHIRYQGFQGNIRATTRPVSFDQNAQDLLMALTPFSKWRTDGGLIVSDDLGSQALRRFYDPTNTNFDARQVAKNAFLAGNDLLYMNNMLSTGDENSYTTILRILESFVQKYNEDSAFASRVDASVQRILAKKLSLYPSFSITDVQAPAEGLSVVGTSHNLVSKVAQDSVTLISPDEGELSSVLPNPPDANDRIIFITDTLVTRQCSTCVDQSIVSVDTLQNAVSKLYGPQSGGYMASSRMSSYSFTDLKDFLDGKEGMEQFTNDLQLADWVVISFLKLQSNQSSAVTLSRFLSEKTNLLLNKKVIGFSFNAPYYLDATDISKFTAYYAFYSKTPEFFTVAARILFEESNPSGSLPVDVPGIGYELISATSPKSDQVIHLYLTSANATSTETVQGTPTPTTTNEVLAFKMGDMLSIATSVILDSNDHPVPDGTVVRFSLTNRSSGEGSLTQQIEATTVDGVGKIEFRIQNPGMLDISASSEPALTSDVLSLNVEGESVSAAITLVVTLPTSAPTETPPPTNTVAPTSTLTETPEPTASPTVTPSPVPDTKPGDWFVSMGLISAGAVGLFWFSPRNLGIRWRVRRGLTVALGGLLVYSYFAFGLPGTASVLLSSGNWIVLPFTLLGIVMGWAVGWLWQYYANKID